MRKRPLCLIAIFLLLIIWILPKDIWLNEPDISSGEKIMIQFEELRLSLLDYEEKLGQLREALGLDDMNKEIEVLEAQTAEDGFWNDLANSQKVQQRISQLKNKVGAYNALENEYNDTLVLIELSNEEEDLDMFDECKAGVDGFVSKLEAMTLSTLLSGEYDSKNAILTFHAGAGGTEAQDWNQMLVRMYQHWGEKHGFKVSTLDFLDGDEAGLKSAVVLFEGENVLLFLKTQARHNKNHHKFAENL